MRNSDISREINQKVKAASQFFQFDITEKKRTKKLAESRMIFSDYCLRNGYNSKQIGKAINIDSSTVRKNSMAYRNLKTTDREFCRKIFRFLRVMRKID